MNPAISNRLVAFCIFLLLTNSAQSAGNNSFITDSIAEDDSSLVRITSILLIGNKVTKNHIILRELTFHQHDTIPRNLLVQRFKRSEETLYNTSLFNSVNITWVQDKDEIQVFIIMAERWYIFPVPIFEVAERNFNVWWQTKDFSRIVYGAYLDWNNFRGRNEQLSLSVRLGYTQRISFYYNVPFITRKQRAGISVGFFYSRNHQTEYATIYNTIYNFKDEDLYAKREYGGYLQYNYRKNLYVTHTLEAGTRNTEVLDTVTILNPDFLTGGAETQHYSYLKYFFRIDHRDLVAYPLQGKYFDIELAKMGLSVFNDDIDFSYIQARFNKYWKLSRKFYFAAGTTAKLSDKNHQPYHNIRALGYGKEIIRSYEYYVIDGYDFALFKTNLKFELLGKHVVRADFIPLTKFNTIPYAFYLNLYSDAAYVKNSGSTFPNSLENNWQIGYGAGLDFVTYYDIVLRLEYSLNKLGESGFFLHFTAPI